MSESVFWYDEIKKLRTEPAKRLKAAVKQLPLPAAFREAHIACRALIRERMQKKMPHDELLLSLYQLMVWEDLLLSTPYIEDIREPGFNVACSIPFAEIRHLPIPYDEIGYEKLSANKTDVKWFVTAWGEPHSHVSAQTYHAVFWNSYLERYREKQRAREARFLKSLTEPPARQKVTTQKKQPEQLDVGKLLSSAVKGVFKLMK